MTSPKVLIADSISQRGVDELTRDDMLDVSVQTKLSPVKLIEIIPEFAALIVRSETKVTGEVLNAAKKMRVVGRAGVGVDNVDVETATRRGVLVLNAPGGNTVSTAEHTFSLLLCVARKIPQADASLRGKKWSRKDFEGIELYNKTLGVIGMGRIGSELSRRAIAFGMRVVAYDPYLSAARARSLQVELVEELDDLLATADFISLHTPLTDETRHLLNAARISKTKRGVRIINCARGGLIDETALASALQDRQVAAAALDVFEIEPLPDDSPLRAAPAFAERLGLKVTETRLSAAGDYTDLVELSADAEGKIVSVGGAFFGATPRIVSVNSRPVEARPHGVILVLENTDRPGMVGRIGTLLGEHNVNIATMSLSRNQAGGTALTILNLDNAPGEQLLQEIRASGDIHSAQVIQL